MTKTKQPAPRTISDAELDQASGGLLPAKPRKETPTGDPDLILGAGPGAGPHVK